MNGLIGYLITYQVNAMRYWWSIDALRYSFVLYITIVLGFFIHYERLKFERFWDSQEILLLLFLGTIWLSMLSMPSGANHLEAKELAVKMTKVAFMLIIASHLITTWKIYRIYILTCILIVLFLGWEMFNAPDWMFRGGRYQSGIGGTDFTEGNFLAIHFAVILPFIAVFFLRGGWFFKAVCIAAGVLSLNSIVQIRSRGSFLALMAGAIIAAIFNNPIKRSTILFCTLIAALGFFAVTDNKFWERMGTIEADQERMDSSAQGRVLAWKAALEMVVDHPFGVGVGNFTSFVGRYNPDIPGKDTHNTFFRCMAELGIIGFSLLCAMILNAFSILRKTTYLLKDSLNSEKFLMMIFAARIALVIQIVGSMLLTHTYIEDFYWVLMHPVFLKRVTQNAKDSILKISQ